MDLTVDCLYKAISHPIVSVWCSCCCCSRSLAGILSLWGFLHLRRTTKDRKVPAVPPLLRNPSRNTAPWRFPKPSVKMLTEPGPRTTGIIGFVMLVQAYFLTGRFSLFWEDTFYAAAGMGFPLTIAMHRSLCVLMGHLTWVAIGAIILKIIPRPQPFFGGGYKRDDDTSEVTGLRNFRWFTSTWNTYWLWWAIGGYFVSAWMFNIADFINQFVLPKEVFEATAEGVVSQLINPEHNDLVASVVGCIAPCLSAPWWEEVLYRGFMLPAMCLHMPFWPSVMLSGVVFSAHHLSATGAIPLAVLGWTWAAIYAKSGNLLVTILIHAMWNSRVFLGSWLGL
jgi:membrane protease YdiL (CAAX protease family)